MTLQDDIGNGILTGMKSGTDFDSLLGGATSTLYVAYQVVPYQLWDATQSWCLVIPDQAIKLRRVGDTVLRRYTFLAEFHIAPRNDRGLARTQIAQGFEGAFGEGGDDLLDTHITDSGSNIRPGGGGEVDWTDEPVFGPKELDGGVEVLTYGIQVDVPTNRALV